ncbi:MAG: hypothetical protein HY057_03225 [Rhodospirillales bacterium]|nr:hypothetical protein [Rhodospirillales bacterium]
MTDASYDEYSEMDIQVISDAIKTLRPDIQVAIIGVVVTVTSAVLGALVVVWQIGKQARYAIAQNRHNEALKLKLEIYKEIVAVCRDTSRACNDLSAYGPRFYAEVELSSKMKSDEGRSFFVPKEPIPVLRNRNIVLAQKLIEIMGLAERWQIIDPRIEVIIKATLAAKYDIDNAYKKYEAIVFKIMPLEPRKSKPNVTEFYWKTPNEDTIAQLKNIGDRLVNALLDFLGYIYDFQVEMQNLLLGELFQHKLPAREPLGHDSIVIRLDRYKELMEYFDQKSAYGRDISRIEKKIVSGNAQQP